MQKNQDTLNNKFTKVGVQKIKMLTIEQFNRTKSKLKEFLTQIRLKLQSKKTSLQCPKT